VPDVAQPVLVEIDRVLEIARRHELRLSHRTRPRPGHGLCVDVAALHDCERLEQLAAKEIGAPRLPRQRGQRLEDGIRAGELAVMRFKAPDGEHDARRNPVLGADAPQQRPLFDGMLPSHANDARRHTRPEVAIESDRELGLRGVALDDPRNRGEAGKRGAD
jgi:hypothetical protein